MSVFRVGLSRPLSDYNRCKMRFRISHILLLSAVVAFALSLRHASIEAADDKIVYLSALASSAIISLVMPFLGDRTLPTVICATIFAFGVLFGHMLECWLETPATEYVWHGQYWRYYCGIYVFIGGVSVFGCGLLSWVTSTLVRSWATTPRDGT